jgi:hypothetical protein
LLQAEFGPRFAGGLEPTAYALRTYPALVKDRTKTSKRAYLEQVRTTDICVGSLGLGDANGWKIGEYVAASRAIVNERMRYLVPGGFGAPVNFLEFATSSECVERVGELLDSPDRVLEMKIANHDYYMRYLRPDQMIMRTLETAAREG